MSTRRTTTQLAGLLLSGLVLSGQAATFAHLALVRHVTCAEHGELVHASDESVRRPPTQAGATVDAFASTVDHHRHDHCLVCIFRRETSSGLVPVLQSAGLWRGVESAAAARPAVVGAAVARYRLAPKTSPPA